MSSYIDPLIVTDPDDLAAQAFAELQSRVPGWLPNEGNFETIFVDALALLASVVAFKASGEPRAIFRWFGPLVGITALDAAPATATTTWTARDTAGYTISAGTTVGIRTAGDELVPFTVLGAVEIPAGDSATPAGAVTIVAVNPGAAGSGIGTSSGPVELVDPLDWVAGITLAAPTSGGVDAESDDDYLARLRSELQLLTPRPILPDDFAVLARTVAAVYRVVAIDGYNPADSTTGNPRMIALAAIDSAGNAVSSGTKSAVASYLEGLREVNFVVNVMDPTFTLIDVTAQVAVADGWDSATVVANVQSAITSWLDPLNWGVPASGDPLAWEEETTVRYLDLVYAVRRVPGVDHIATLTFAAHPNALATADVVMTGHATLPKPNTITVTHT